MSERITKLKNELIEWTKMYEQVLDIVKELEKKYKCNKSIELKKVLDSWYKEKEAYEQLLKEDQESLDRLVEERLLQYNKKKEKEKEENLIYSSSLGKDIEGSYKLIKYYQKRKIKTCDERISLIKELLAKIDTTGKDGFKTSNLVLPDGSKDVYVLVDNRYVDMYEELWYMLLDNKEAKEKRKKQNKVSVFSNTKRVLKKGIKKLKDFYNVPDEIDDQEVTIEQNNLFEKEEIITKQNNNVDNKIPVMEKIKGLTRIGLLKIKHLSDSGIKKVRKNKIRNDNYSSGKISNLTKKGLAKIKTLTPGSIKKTKYNRIGDKERKLKFKTYLIGGVSLALVTTTMFFSACLGCTSNNAKKKATKIADVKIVKLEEETVEPEIEETNTDHNKTSNESIDVSLGSRISVKKGSKIFDNVYDASKKTNGLTPYFSYNSSNDVVGMFLQNNNRSVSFVSSDNGNTYEYTVNGKTMYLTSREASSKIKSLENKGWSKKVVVVKSEYALDGVTGAYNIDDIKVKKL